MASLRDLPIDEFIDALSVPCCYINLDGNVLLWNEHAETLFGWERDEVLHHPLPVVQHLEHTLETWSPLLLQYPFSTTAMTPFKHKNGSVVYATAYLQSFSINDFTGYFLAFLPKGFSPLISTEQFNLLHHFQAMIEQSTYYLAANAYGEITEVNPLLCGLIGAPDHQFIGRNWFELIHPSFENDPIAEDVLQALTTDRIWNGEMPIRSERHTANTCWLNLTVVPILSEEGEVVQYTAFGFDVSDKKRLEQEVNYLAYHNDLTGLLNKKGWLRQYAHVLKTVDQGDGLVHVALFDIDRFKIINESFGSRVGNELLLQIKDRAAQFMPETSVMFHPSGGLFGLIFFEESKEEVFQLLRQLQHELQRPFRIYHHSIMVSISIGCVFYPSATSSLEELYTRAESALFKGKRIGVGTIQFVTKDMDDAFSRQIHIEKALYQALEEKHFYLEYQPKYELQTDTLIGFEALLRWHHEELGQIPPSEFIPLAEEMALIVPINNWVILEAAKQLKAWQQLVDHPLSMAVNISPNQFRSDSFINTLRNIKQQLNLNPSDIILEITESLVMQQTDEIIARMDQIKRLDYRLSIDDFGTGFSSLQYLKSFPVDELKIDKVFLDDWLASKSHLLDVIVHLGKSLNLHVVAEGVEDQEMLDHLKQTACDSFQGFLYAKPLPPIEVVRLLSEKNH
ncbi:EAL domain-containing protein [Exiguobacterium sp. s141]|uniref:EAL domain-containing protein n=1 Tax=Exiguobacterium sp. s141 TaxID=2751240 RepID=UPI001BE5D556